MAESKSLPLTYKGHPLRRKDNLIYYGSMADPYIIMLQILSTEKVKDMEVATKVSIQLQHAGPEGNSALTGYPLKAGTGLSARVKRTASTPQWTWATYGCGGPLPPNKRRSFSCVSIYGGFSCPQSIAL